MSRLIPRGVVVAGLGRRFLAAILDALPVAIAYGAMLVVLQFSRSAAVNLVAIIGASVLCAAFALYQWWAYATRGAGIGARATGLRLVSLKDGQPIGWWRVFLRQLVFNALIGTVVGGIALLIFLVIHERRQGWHDMVAGSVVVEPKPSEAKEPVHQRKTAAPSTVGLPPHLASSFSPQPGTTAGWSPESSPPAGPAAPPDWLPGLKSEPLPPDPWAAPSAMPAPAPVLQPVAQSQAAAPQQPWTGQPSHNGVPQGAVPSASVGQPVEQPAQPAWPGQPSSSAPGAPTAEQAQGVWPGQPQSSGQSWGQNPAAQPPARNASPEQPLPSPSRPAQNWIPIPSASSVIEPSRKVRVKPRDFGEVEDDDGTRISSLPSSGLRGGDEGWYVRLDDGREVELSVIVLLGRNPHKNADDPEEVHLVPASGDGRMISRTHVLIGTDPRGVFIMDRGSTNGTALVKSGGDLEPCPPGTQVRVKEGQQVSYGNRCFTVLRRPAL